MSTEAYSHQGTHRRERSKIRSMLSPRNLPLGPRGTFYGAMYGIGGALTGYSFAARYSSSGNTEKAVNYLEHAVAQPSAMIGIGMLAVGGVAHAADSIHKHLQGQQDESLSALGHPIEDHVAVAAVNNPLLLEDMQ